MNKKRESGSREQTITSVEVEWKEKYTMARLGK
jgi:hypothetical protein